MDNNNDNNNNNNESLFNMFGTEEKKKEEETPQINQTPIEKEKEQENLAQVTNTEQPVEEKPVDNKPIPDEIMKEVHENVDNSKEKEKELLKLYIGPNAEKMMQGGFSFHTLFLGVYYLFYRKQYNYVFPLMLLQIGSGAANLLPFGGIGMVILVAELVLTIWIAAKFKGEYIAKAQETVHQITSNISDPEEQKKAAQQAGGVDKRFWILIILLMVISYVTGLSTLKIQTDRYSSDVEFHFPEDFKPFEAEAARNETSYKVGKYSYDNLVFNFRDSDNVCTFRILFNNEYNSSSKNSLEVAKKYMKDKHDIKEELEEKEINLLTFYYYYNEKAKEDTYILVTEKSLTEINVSYVQDTNKKCHEYTDYILENLKISK